MSIENAAKRLTEILNASVPPNMRSMVIRTEHDENGNQIKTILVSARSPYQNKLRPPSEIDGFPVLVVPWED